MATPVNFSTMSLMGVDTTAVYVSTAQSVNPELSPQQVALGTDVLGTNSGEFVFVQASTSISASDFVAITATFQANSMTSTNAITAGMTIGVAPASAILAGQFFWAQTRGKTVTANLGSASSTGVILYTTAVAGVLSSVTGSNSSIAIGGVICVTSNSSLTATAGVVVMSWPRVVQLSTTLFNLDNP